MAKQEIGWIGEQTWTFNIGDRVRVHNHFDPDVGVKYGTVVGQDQMYDQYFDVKIDELNRAGEVVVLCEDKNDLSLVEPPKKRN